MFHSLKIIIALVFISACNNSEFYERPKPASLEFGQVQNSSSSSFLSTFSTNAEPAWVKMDAFDMGRQPMGTVSLFEFGFRNVGNLPADIKEIRLRGENIDSFFLKHNCRRTLKNMEICPVQISYNPATIGKMPSKMVVTYDNGSTGIVERILPISAAANNLAFLKFESNIADLQTSTVGQTKSAFLKVLYNGTNVVVAEHPILPARGVIMADPSDSSITIDRGPETTCGEVINTDCVIKVNFTPTAEGLKTGNIGLTYFNGAEVLKIEAAASGTGILAIRLAQLSAANLSFGNSIVNPATPAGLSVPVNFTGSVAAENVVITAPATSSYAISTDPMKTTCTGTISGNCSLFVTFSPSRAGTHNDSIKINYKSQGVSMPQVSISLLGSGVGSAQLKSDVANLNFGSLPAHKGAIKYFNLTNIGAVAVSALSSITVSDPTSFTAVFESCANLVSGGACRIKVNFNGASSALYSSDISFTYFDGRSVVPMALTASGSGTSPLVMEGARTIDFGNVMIGGPVLPNPINVNLGIYGTTLLSDPSQLIISTLALANPFSFVAASTPGTTSNCRAPLNPNSSNSCAFGVGLVANTGFAADVPVIESFSIGYTGDGANGSGVLNFTAKMTPRIPPSLTFLTAAPFKKVSVGHSASVTFTVKNNSPYFATSFKTISTSGSSAFTVSSNGCSGGLVANGTCNIVVTFRPTEAGIAAGFISYTYNDQIQNQIIAEGMTAEGSDDVTLLASGTTVDFGSVFVGDVIAEKSVNIKYYGKNTWTNFSDVAAPFSIDASDCGEARDCVLKIKYTPTAAGSSSRNVKLTYSPGLPVLSELNFNFRGVAQMRTASLALSPTNFPKTLKGESFVQTLTLKNNGSLLASDISVAALTGAFSIVSDLTASNCAVKTALDQGESCTIKVKFSPTSVEASTASMDVNYTNGATALMMANTLTGQGTQRLQVFAGAFQTCMINELGKAICWGRYLPVQKPQSVTPINFGVGIEVKKLTLGDKHTCALLTTASSEGKVSCWSNIASPAIVDLAGDIAVDISAGFEHTCALLKTGQVKCWGQNSSGQLGTGLNDFGMKAIAVSAGAGHTCVLLENDSMKCWGDNFYGQLGQGLDAEQIPMPSETIDLGSNFTPASISASSGAFTCATSTDGKVKCFGKTVANETTTPFFGVLGSCWSRTARNATATQCPSDLRNAAMSIGYFANDMGDNLAKVNLGSGVVEELSVGTSFSCAVLADKSVKCWGLNLSGQLGIGSQLNMGARVSEMGDNLIPVKLEQPVVQVATGYEHACAVLEDNTLKCWGTGLNNATGLNAHGIIANTGTNAGNTPSALPVIYSGK